MKTIVTALSISLLLSTAAFSVDYNEGPDLSNNPGAPTQLGILTTGSNRVSGTIGFGDRDCFTFVIPNGSSLTNINVINYIGFFDLGNIFLDVGGAAPTPTGGNGNAFIGGMLLAIGDAGTDILPELASGGLGTTGFNIPLGAGVYTVVFTDTETFNNSYNLDFVIDTIPGGGGGGGGGVVNPIFYQPRPDQPDLIIGKKRNKGRGNDIYNGGNQQLNLRSERARRVDAFLTVQNDGIQQDVYSLKGSSGNRLFRVKYLKRSGNSGNVTADMIAGTHFTDALQIRERATYEVRVIPIRSRLRKRGRYLERHRIFKFDAQSLLDSLSIDRAALGVWTDN